MSVETFRFPSKTFLVGEYAILQGSRALLLGHPPLFESSFTSGAMAHPFHPESPAGLWLQKNPQSGEIRFQDPHFGKGGFGGSGAEFLSAWIVDQEVPAPDLPRAIFAWSAWEASREFPGSGADILVQSYGVNRKQPFFLLLDIERRNLTELFCPEQPKATLSLFHTGRKVATHEQKRPEQLPVQELDAIVERSATYLEQGMIDGLATELQAYGEKLAKLGLVAPHTAQALKALEGKKDVLAAKGCGAMGSDVILVLHKEEDLQEWAKENSLAPVGSFPV